MLSVIAPDPAPPGEMFGELNQQMLPTMSGTMDEDKLKVYSAATLYSQPTRTPHEAWAKDGEDAGRCDRSPPATCQSPPRSPNAGVWCLWAIRDGVKTRLWNVGTAEPTTTFSLRLLHPMRIAIQAPEKTHSGGSIHKPHWPFERFPRIVTTCHVTCVKTSPSQRCCTLASNMKPVDAEGHDGHLLR